MLEELTNTSEEEFNDLANQGMIGPYANDFICIGYVIDDKKPIALIDEDAGIFASMYGYKYNVGLKVSLVPENREWRNASQTNRTLLYAVYKDYLVFDELCKICKLNDPLISEPSQVFYAIKMGAVLGYKKEDITKFLHHNYGYQRVKYVFSNWRLKEIHGGYAIDFQPQ